MTNKNPFKDEYSSKKLEKIAVENFNMYITPRYRTHYVEQSYEPFSTSLVKAFIKPNSTFVDVGAHYGYYSLLASKAKENVKVIAIEPIKETSSILKKNFKLNKIKDYEVLTLAASNKSGTSTFNMTEASDSASFYEHPNTKTKKIIEVKTESLDNILKGKKVDFMKIDVEGHEISTLDGLEKTIKKNKDLMLLIEFNPKMQRKAGTEPDNLLRKVESLGFEIYLLDELKKQFYRLSDNKFNWKEIVPENFNYSNLLCIPKHKSLSVTFFSHSSNLAGAELSLIELIDELVEKKTMVHVVLPMKGVLYEELLVRPVSLTIVPYGWWIADHIGHNMNSYIELLSSLNSFIKINSHILYTNTVVIPWGAVAAFLLNKPHIWHVREFGKDDYSIKFNYSIDNVKKIIDDMSDHVITNSKALRNYYLDTVSPKKITYSYNFIDKSKFRSNNTEKKYFHSSRATKLLMLGTVTAGKGQQDAMRAAAILIKKGIEVELVIAGSLADNQYVKGIKNYIKRNNLQKNIQIHDFIKEPYGMIKECSVLLVCSKNEAFGRVIVEAMLYKKPVIGTSRGGVLELIQDNYNGLLYDPGNIDQLVKKIEQLHKNKILAKELGNNAYSFITKTIIKENYGGKIYNILQDVVRRESSKSRESYVVFMLEIAKAISWFQSSIERNNQEKEQLQNEKEKIEKEKEQLQAVLENITSAKTFKVWQKLNRIKKMIRYK